jgi:hypothetical protein
MRLSQKYNAAFPANETSRRNTKSLFQLFILTLLLITIPIALGADFWEKKDYKEWKDRDCVKMLTNSPWAKSYNISRGSDPSSSLDGSLPVIRYTARFNSALPVRQATIRMQQIANKYDDLPAEQKQQFDQSANKYLATAFNDIILIQVEFTTNMRNDQIPLINHWQQATTEHIKNTTYLYGSKDAKVPLLEFVPPQGNSATFQLIFPRQYEGKPIVTPEDKTMKLEFLAFPNDEEVLLDFKVKDMILDGEVVY